MRSRILGALCGFILATSVYAAATPQGQITSDSDSPRLRPLNQEMTSFVHQGTELFGSLGTSADSLQVAKDLHNHNNLRLQTVRMLPFGDGKDVDKSTNSKSA